MEARHPRRQHPKDPPPHHRTPTPEVHPVGKHVLHDPLQASRRHPTGPPIGATPPHELAPRLSAHTPASTPVKRHVLRGEKRVVRPPPPPPRGERGGSPRGAEAA